MSDDVSRAFSAALARHQAGDLTAAEQFYRAVLQRDPQHAAALCNLGAVLVRFNRLDEAARCYAACLAAHPNHADAHFNFGNLFRRVGQFREALHHYQACLGLNPNHGSAAFNLGLTHVAVGDFTAAVAAYRRAAALDPGNVDAVSRLGDVLLRTGDTAGGVEAFGRVLAVRPNEPRAMNNLALALSNAGRHAEAVELLERALAIKPDYADAHNTYALTCEALHRKDDAARHYEEAVRLKPDFADAWSNLGTNLTEQGRIDEAADALRRSLAIRPNAHPIHSNLLLTLNYSSKLTPEDVTAEHRKWAEAFAPPTPPPPVPADRSPDRRLKVGYLSADFRAHTVAGFIEQLLTHHDRTQFHVTAFANVGRPDEMTHKLRGLADDWRPIPGLTDDQVAELIRADKIDVLIDLSGHTAGNRLLVLARRPAPIQCTLFGYPNTTGMKAVDYRITDSVSDPSGMTEHLYAEGLLRLPHLPWVYLPPPDAPEVRPLPALTGDTFTFGCLNNAAKISDGCLETWAKLLREVPHSRLVLLAGQSQVGANRLTERFAAAGVPADQLEFVFRLPRNEYFEAYSSFDLALDPFPYNGGVTTCDALWMGVPVLAVAGKSYVSRQGAAILTDAGLNEFVAESLERLVVLAKEWGGKREALAAVRAGLRSRVANSTVADGAAYVRDMEAALRRAWRERVAA
jgi:predicted O-linked N-acetylglucosamine transferase (SPINDLY family)